MLFFRLQSCVYVLPAERCPCALQARVRVLLAAPLAVQPVLLPVTDGVCVLDYKLVYPGEGLRKQYVTLEEAQVASVLGQGKYHVRHFLWRGRQRDRIYFYLFLFCKSMTHIYFNAGSVMHLNDF